MTRALPSLLAAFLLWVPARAVAQNLTVRGPDPEVVRLGGQSVITLSVEGSHGDAELLALPTVDGVDMAPGRPSQSSYQSIINGRITAYSSISWQIMVEPRREGVFEIPPLGVRVAGKELRSKALRVEAVRDVTGEKYAFLEMAAPHDTYFVQEPIRLRLRFGIDVRFYQNNIIQLFRTRLAVPVQLQARWLAELPGTVTLEDEAAQASGRSGQRVTFALNDNIAEAQQVGDVERDGRTFAVFEIEKGYLPNRSGELQVPAPLLRFAYATRFQEDFFNGRVAADRRDAFVYGKPLSLDIKPLPEAGRPAGFTGAVGRFTVAAEATPRELKVGESLKLTLRIEGEGNLEFLDPPRLDELPGFHVYGKIEEKQKNRRTVVYDLAPLSDDVKAVPAIPFAYFDTNPPAGYRAVQTEPIPLTVRPLPEGARLKPLPGDEARRAVPGENDVFDMKPVAALARGTVLAPAPALVALALGLPWVLAGGLLWFLNHRERLRRDPDAVRARGALAAFRGALARPDADVAEALAGYLAARLRCPSAAVIAPDLPARLRAAGIAPELADRAAALLDALVAARYGGGAAGARGAEATQLVDALEAAFRQHGGRRA